MKDEIFYEPLGEANYQRTITAFESEIARLNRIAAEDTGLAD